MRHRMLKIAVALSAFLIAAHGGAPLAQTYAPVKTNVCQPIPTPLGPIQTSYVEDIGTKHKNFVLPSDRHRDACLGRTDTPLGPVYIENVAINLGKYCSNDSVKQSLPGRDKCKLNSDTLRKMQSKLNQKCFGAVGDECSLGASTCVNNTCWINSGSIKHDECCYANYKRNLDLYLQGKPIRLARGCAAGLLDDLPFATSSECAPSWNEAKQRLAQFRNWQRTMNFSKVNSTGKVVKADIYATKGTRLHKDDGQYCLNGSRLLNPMRPANERAERFGAFEVVCK